MINFTFDKKFKDKYCVGFHPNPMGYYLIALMFGNYIDYIIRFRNMELLSRR